MPSLESKCKGKNCRADIIFCTVDGKKQVLNRVRTRGYTIDEHGEGHDEGLMHVSHFATCPDRDQFRKRFL